MLFRSATKTKNLLGDNAKISFIHSALYYNLAGSTEGESHSAFSFLKERTIDGMVREMDCGASFGSGVVVHVGSSKNKKAGTEQIVDTINRCLTRVTPFTRKMARDLSIPFDEFVSSRTLILENAAGEGNKVGSTLEEIATIVNSLPESVRGQVKICIDTAHLFGAGKYDMGRVECVDSFFKDFDELIGVDRLALFHLNDSRAKFGSRVDRHENIGLGYIFGCERRDSDGTEGLKRLVEKASEHGIPLVGETPGKTKSGTPGLSGIWDYNFLAGVVPLEEEVC